MKKLRWTALFIILNALVSFIVYLAALDHEDKEIAAQFRRIFEKQVGMLQRDLAENFEVVVHLGMLFHSIENVGNKEFSKYLAEEFKEHPSAFAFEWIPRVPLSQKEKYELAAKELQSDFYIYEKDKGGNIPVTVRQEYYPVYYVEPKEPNAAALGYDLASNPVRRIALEKARDGGKLTATEPITLLQESDKNVKAFLVFMPVYYGKPETAEERQRDLKGFSVGIFRVKDIFWKNFNIKGYLNEHAVFDIEDIGLPVDERQLYRHGTADSESSKLKFTKLVDIAGRTFKITATPAKDYFAKRRSLGPITFASGSFLIIGLLAGLFTAHTRQTSQVQAQVALRTRELEASEAKTRAILDSAVNSIIIIDHAGTVQLFNKAAENAFGYDAGEVLGQNVKMLMPEPYKSAHDQYLSNYVTTGNKKIIGIGREVMARKKDGTKFPIDLSVSEIKSTDRRPIFLGLIVDISKRKENEEALRHLSERLSLAVRSGGIGIWDYDASTGKLIWNEQMFLLYDILPENFTGSYSDWTGSLHPDDRKAAEEKLGAALKGDGDFDLEFRIVTSTGERSIKSASITQKDSTGLPVRVIGINMDITAERKRERELKELTEDLKTAKDLAEAASRAKSEFLSSMSHEIRTPLNAIIGMAELLSETQLTDEQKKYIDTFRHAGDGLLEIINDILDLSKVEAGLLELELTCFDLNELLERIGEVMSFRAHQKGLELNMSHVTEHIGLVGDPLRLRQVIVNLVGNAIKFTERGEISVIVEKLDSSDLDIGLKFSIRDTGIGIPTDRLDSVFERFTQVDSSTTRKYGGTGLGLSISKRLVEMMGGQITVESEYGRGSVFSFTAKFRADNECKLSLKPVDIDISGLSVLIVDDNATNRLILSNTVTTWGAVPHVADRGQSALDMLRESKMSAQRFDVVLLDMNMPGLDGFDVTREIRNDPNISATPVIILTSGGVKTKAADELGIVAFMSKPVKKTELKEAIVKALGGRSVSKKETSTETNDIRPVSILLVEDNEDNRNLILMYLKKTSHRIETAENGQIAVDKFIGGRFDLVLMDMEMPVKDGLTAAREIRQWEAAQKAQRTTILALTAHALKEHEQKSREAGCDGHLTKPVKKAVLLDAIRNFAADL